MHSDIQDFFYESSYDLLIFIEPKKREAAWHFPLQSDNGEMESYSTAR